MTTKRNETQPQPKSSWREFSHYLVPSNQGKLVLHQSESITSVYQRKQRLSKWAPLPGGVGHWRYLDLMDFRRLSVSGNVPETGTNSSSCVPSSLPGDFRGWRALKQQPCKLMDNLKVHQGLVPVGASREGLLVQEPFQSITSYRSQYISHPLQNRARSAVPVCRHHFNDFLQHFKS